MKANEDPQKKLDALLAELKTKGKTPTLLLHACCAPCASYVLEYLSAYFSMTLFYYNPNITEKAEYEKRIREAKRLTESLPVKHPLSFLAGDYEPALFFQTIQGLENEPEGGARCEACFRLRLQKTAACAKARGFDYFTTTLTVSPLKNATVLNAIGEEAGKEAGVSFLPSNFKKRGGYARSIELSRQYGLYRQNYCGCIYSKR